MVSGTTKYETIKAVKQTQEQKRNDPPIPNICNIEGNNLMERKRDTARKTAVSDEAGPRMEAGNSSEKRIHGTGPKPEAYPKQMRMQEKTGTKLMR